MEQHHFIIIIIEFKIIFCTAIRFIMCFVMETRFGVEQLWIHNLIHQFLILY